MTQHVIHSNDKQINYLLSLLNTDVSSVINALIMQIAFINKCNIHMIYCTIPNTKLKHAQFGDYSVYIVPVLITDHYYHRLQRPRFLKMFENVNLCSPTTISPTLKSCRG